MPDRALVKENEERQSLFWGWHKYFARQHAYDNHIVRWPNDARITQDIVNTPLFLSGHPVKTIPDIDGKPAVELVLSGSESDAEFILDESTEKVVIRPHPSSGLNNPPALNPIDWPLATICGKVILNPFFYEKDALGENYDIATLSYTLASSSCGPIVPHPILFNEDPTPESFEFIPETGHFSIGDLFSGFTEGEGSHFHTRPLVKTISNSGADDDYDVNNTYISVLNPLFLSENVFTVNTNNDYAEYEVIAVDDGGIFGVTTNKVYSATDNDEQLNYGVQLLTGGTNIRLHTGAGTEDIAAPYNVGDIFKFVRTGTNVNLLQNDNIIKSWTGANNQLATMYRDTQSYYSSTDLDIESQVELSIGFWFYYGSGTGGGILGTESGFPHENTVGILKTNDTVKAYVSNGSATFGTTPAASIPDNLWTHIVVVFNGAGATNADRLKIYINKVEQSLSFSGTIPALTSATMGSFLFGKAIGSGANNKLRLADIVLELGAWNQTVIDNIYDTVPAGAYYWPEGDGIETQQSLANMILVGDRVWPIRRFPWHSMVTMEANSALEVSISGPGAVGTGDNLTTTRTSPDNDPPGNPAGTYTNDMELGGLFGDELLRGHAEFDISSVSAETLTAVNFKTYLAIKGGYDGQDEYGTYTYSGIRNLKVYLYSDARADLDWQVEDYHLPTFTLLGTISHNILNPVGTEYEITGIDPALFQGKSIVGIQVRIDPENYHDDHINLNFDGAGDFITIADADGLTRETTPISVVMRINPTTTAGVLLEKENEYKWSFDGTDFLIRITDNDTGGYIQKRIQGAYSVGLKVYAWTYDPSGGVFTFRRNGSSFGITILDESSGSFTQMRNTGNPVIIGSGYTGSIIDVSMYSVVLTATQMNQVNYYSVYLENLIFRYAINEEEGTTLNDYTETYPGIITDATWGSEPPATEFGIPETRDPGGLVLNNTILELSYGGGGGGGPIPDLQIDRWKWLSEDIHNWISGEIAKWSNNQS